MAKRTRANRLASVAKHAQLYGIETTMQPQTYCAAFCMNAFLPSALVRLSAAPTQSRINHNSQFFKIQYYLTKK
ncbi:hypothetical protein SeMB42_g03172 [Synchytrium endobioticum]|uniref:Uncharacterized protein n=1 Tax=Synchytrium endobioticum TaxID=286115 RepID=A0A507DAA4_9FUNG|nr:hypothetical protein SeMB42_g03172 [Synchytrium endobioticum]